MTTHQARRRLKRIRRAVRRDTLKPYDRALLQFHQSLNRQAAQDSKAADAADRRWTP